MKLILQLAVILCIGAINNAACDDKETYSSLIAYHGKEPDIRREKHKNVILRSSTENKHDKNLIKKLYYKDVMLGNEKIIHNKHIKSNDQQILSNNEKMSLYSIPDLKQVKFKDLVITHDIDHDMAATPIPFKKLWKQIIPLHHTAINQYNNQPRRLNFKNRQKKQFKIDSAVNLFKNVRRRAKSDSSSIPSSSSSSKEMQKWKEQFKEQYMKKKFQALNASRPAGDAVNMVAARPWGVPCGDPNQHDIPWGTCMLNAECEPEYRIFRGDNFCGRSEFVCCAIQLNDEDMFQGFDISFDSKSLSTDSEDRKKNDKGSKEKRKKKKERDRKKRKKNRRKRLAKIKKNIKKIVREMKKLLDRQFKNGTKQKKQKTRLLKKFIKKLKQQYKNDREAVADIHEEEMIRIDAALQRKLNELMEMNTNFVKNETFREIVVNGAMSKKGARMLLEAYPDLDPYLHKALRKSKKTRKSGVTSEDHFGENAEYDLEYGYLYFK